MPEIEAMTRTVTRLLLFLVAAFLSPACGGGGGGTPSANLRGGNAVGATAGLVVSGGWGGQVNVFSEGLIEIAPGAAPDAPEVPPAPAGGLEIQSADLTGTDYTLPLGNLRIGGIVQAPSGSDYIIYVLQGDIVIDGTLRAGDSGAGNARNISVRALNGTIFVKGTISANNTDGVNDGNDAGNIELLAQRIVITGRIEAVGETNTGANGGNLTVDTGVALGGPDQIVVGAHIDLSGSAGTPGYVPGQGGNAVFNAGRQLAFHRSTLISNGGGGDWNMTPDIKGGDAGTVTVDAPLSVVLDGRIELAGGDVTTKAGGAWGGDAGRLEINQTGSSGPVHLFATLHMPGGDGRTTGPGNIGVEGGYGGYVDIGNFDPTGAPTAVYIGFGFDADGGSADGAGVGGEGGDLAFHNPYDVWGNLRCELPVRSSGGQGGGIGGAGGDLDFNLSSGEILVMASATLNGGASLGTGVAPVGGVGGYFSASPNKTAGLWGRVHVAASQSMDGGAGIAGAAEGGAGGNVYLGSANTLDGFGDIQVDAVDLSLDGGRGTGGQNGGMGGVFYLSTEGSVVLGGRVGCRGGDSTGGTGGQGGYATIDSDRGSAGGGGDVTFQAGFRFDGSGGNGTAGGNGISDGAAGIDPNDLAFSVTAGDGNVNLQAGARITARGGSVNGDGGDAGIYTTGTVTVSPSAVVDLNGSGSGADGEDNF